MSLLDLPAEVLVMIAEALQETRDINALAQTTRALCSCINYVLYKSDVQNGNEQALIWAARHDKPATAKKSFQAGVKTLKQWHCMPLASALKHGHEAIIRWLLDEGVDPDDILFEGSHMETTALYIAASNGHDAIVKLLVERGASVNLKNAPGEPLVIAASRNKKTVVRLLLEKGADPNARRHDNTTALNAAAMRGNTEIVRMLLNSGANTELGDHNRATPLHAAVFKGHCKITRLLLERGADVGSRDYSGRTPLDVAVKYSSQRLQCLLLKHGANPNAMNSSPLHHAIYFNKITVVRLFLDHGADVNRQDRHGETPLLCAMRFEYDQIVESLLLYDVDPDAKRYDGLTPLKLAIEKNREDWAQKLRRKRNGRKSSRS